MFTPQQLAYGAVKDGYKLKRSLTARIADGIFFRNN